MIDVNQLRKGATFTQNSHLYRVLEYRHHKPGRGKATIRVTVRDLRSGATVEMTFNSGERVDLKFIKDSMEIKLLSYAGEIIDYELPKTMEYVVVEVEAAVAGDTANSPTKKIKLESGFEVSAPMFINVGDVVKINLEDQAYVTRVSK